MAESDRELSRIEANRMAAVTALGSTLVAIGLALAYWLGLFEELVPFARPAASDLPLLLVVPLFLLILVVWSWSRVLSFFD